MPLKKPGNLDNKIFFKSVTALVIPMALQNLINVAVQGADVVMLGMVDEISLSAASLAGQIQFVMMLVFFGLASGASVLTAQYWGKGDVRTIEKIMAMALRLALAVALAFTAAVLLMPAQLMCIFTPEAAVISEGVRYLRFIAPSYPLIAFTNLYLNIIRSVEKAVAPAVVYSISLVTNIAFNSVLIFGLLGFPAMGVAGAALGSTLARTVELCLVAVYAAKNRVLRLRLKDFTRHYKLLFADFAKHALPTTLNELVWSLGVSTNAVIIGHMGAQAVAANSVAQVVRQLATVVSFGVATAAAIMVGKAIGGGDKSLAVETARRMIKIALGAGCVGALVILAIRPLVANTMNLSPQADSYLRYLLLWMSVYVIAQAATSTTIVGVFRGGGDARFGLFADLCTMWGCSILLGALAAFVFHWPVKAVFVILLMDEFVKIPICFLRYRSHRWLRNVTRTETA